MKEIENPLKYELMAGISVFIHPEHAKSINEIKSFTMHFDIMGTMNIDFEREETSDAKKSPD